MSDCVCVCGGGGGVRVDISVRLSVCRHVLMYSKNMHVCKYGCR